MSAIFLLLLIGICIAGFFLGAFIWSVKKGQFEDEKSSAIRILFEDKPGTPKK